MAAPDVRAENNDGGPQYKVVQNLGAATEVRQYYSALVAQVEVSGDGKTALNEGFRILAGYIFGKNTRKPSLDMNSPMVARSERIKMTTPVKAEMKSNKMTVSFFMPDGHTLETLPEPEDRRIHFVSLPAQKLAAIRFSGSWDPATFAKRAQELETSLRVNDMVADGQKSYAYYNPPFMPPFMRRNEVLVGIAE